MHPYVFVCLRSCSCDSIDDHRFVGWLGTHDCKTLWINDIRLCWQNERTRDIDGEIDPNHTLVRVMYFKSIQSNSYILIICLSAIGQSWRLQLSFV
jgi:hypothetical protein